MRGRRAGGDPKHPAMRRSGVGIEHDSDCLEAEGDPNRPGIVPGQRGEAAGSRSDLPGPGRSPRPSFRSPAAPAPARVHRRLRASHHRPGAKFSRAFRGSSARNSPHATNRAVFEPAVPRSCIRNRHRQVRLIERVGRRRRPARKTRPTAGALNAVLAFPPDSAHNRFLVPPMPGPDRKAIPEGVDRMRVRMLLPSLLLLAAPLVSALPRSAVAADSVSGRSGRTGGRGE